MTLVIIAVIAKKRYNLIMPKIISAPLTELKDFELANSVAQEKPAVKETIPGRIEKFKEDFSRQIKEVELPKAVQAGKLGARVTTSAVVKPVLAKQLPHYQEVEKILESGLESIFLKLPPAKKREFKIQGEQAADQITRLLNSTTIKIFEFSKKVFKLIFSWLKIIPGVNKFFIEQEAKIKADQLLALKQK